ncbi:MAG: toll/interleukin-1 receptor domain-containing protein, partial [Eudoraea sp.]|nr:toll/interleukin-1 receptor domain-containing protein [Eudoraea sp.]
MFWKKKRKGKIFISYRRSDTQGYAGRLSDSLANYFVENRVFRDIEDITGGSEYATDFEEHISS